MPRGKELEQLPMSNIAPGAGEDSTKMDRENLQGMMGGEQVTPAKAGNDQKKRG